MKKEIINCAIRSELRDSYELLVLEVNSGDFYFAIEGNFSIQLYSRDCYLEAFSANGFLTARNVIVAWETGLWFADDQLKVVQAKADLPQLVESIRFGTNTLESVAKLGRCFPVYEFAEEMDSYQPFASYKYPFGGFASPFEFNIEKHDIFMGVDSNDFKIRFQCSVCWLESGEHLVFEVLAFSPIGLTRDSAQNAVICPPHIIANQMDIVGIMDFLRKSIQYFNASTFEELKLKLCTISNSISLDELVQGFFCGDYEIRLKVEQA